MDASPPVVTKGAEVIPVRQVLETLAPFYMEQRSRLVLCAALMIGASISSVFIPRMANEILESEGLSTPDLLWLAGRLVAVIGAYHGVSLAGHLVAYAAGVRVEHSLIKHSCKLLTVVDWEEVVAIGPAEKAQQIVTSARFAGDAAAMGLTDLVPSIVATVGLLGMVVSMAPVLTITLAVVLVGMQLLQRLRANETDKRSADAAADEVKLLALVTNVIQRNAVVRLFRCYDYVEDELRRRASKSLASLQVLNYSIHSTACVVTAATNMLLAVVVVGSVIVKSSNVDFTISNVALYFFYLGQLVNRATTIGTQVNIFLTTAQKVGPLVKLQKLARSAIPDTQPLEGGSLLSLIDVSYRYANREEYALKDISINVVRGEYLAIIGPSGGGKTTLLRILVGLLRPTKGNRESGADITLIEQGSSLVFGSVRDNISLGYRGAPMEEVIRAAKKGGCHEFIEQLPAGYDTSVDNIDVAGFSGGQVQRICLARAFLSSSPVVVLDEPTTGLDPARAKLFHKAALGLRAEGRTLIVVTHDLGLVDGSDKVLWIEGGCIRASGTYEQVAKLVEH